MTIPLMSSHMIAIAGRTTKNFTVSDDPSGLTTAAGADEVSATTAALFAAHTILLDAAYTIAEDLRYY